MASNDSVRLKLAKSMLKRSTFSRSDAGAETIWRQQYQRTRDAWLAVADGVIEDLAESGLELTAEIVVKDLELEPPAGRLKKSQRRVAAVVSERFWDTPEESRWPILRLMEDLANDYLSRDPDFAWDVFLDACRAIGNT